MKTLLFATVLLPGHMFACLNAGRPEPTNRYVVDHHLVTNLRLVMAKDSRQVKAADKFGKSKSPQKMRELQALDLILQGQPQAALPILQELEKTAESRYNSAAAAVTGLVIQWERWIPLVLLPILLPFWIKLKLSQPESWMYWAWQRCKPWLTTPISFRPPARSA